jgi:uncharacterized glyoxalase superfamily protein PhnB
MKAPNPPKGMCWITSHLYYEDVSAALIWLERVFGFLPAEKAVTSSGIIDFAEMSYCGELIILSKGPHFSGVSSPKNSQCYSQHIHMYVDDIDAFYQHCLDEGAQCLTSPEYIYWGDMLFRVLDCEGHMWTFAQHIKDVSEENLSPPE